MAAFRDSKAAAEAALRDNPGRFYVYVLSRPDGVPFYIGKGINRRVFDHESEARQNHPIGESNPFKCNVIRKIIREGGTVGYAIDSFYDSAQQNACLERESTLILQHKRLHEGGVLTNLAGGVGNFSGAAPFSLDRHAATLSGEPENNPERAVLNRFLQSIGPVGSVPIKPIGQISRILPTTPHPNPRKPTVRNAYALIASASATGSRLVPGVRLPRTFIYQGVTAVIENGVARDMLKSGIASLVAAPDPSLEVFTLSAPQIDLVKQLYGATELAERGLI